MKMFIDTHDKDTGTFPAGISRVDFAGFYEKYKQACREEGVVSLQIHVGMDEGRAFCVNLARDADAVRRVHERVGLAFDTITQVSDVSAYGLFAPPQAA